MKKLLLCLFFPSLIQAQVNSGNENALPAPQQAANMANLNLYSSYGENNINPLPQQVVNSDEQVQPKFINSNNFLVNNNSNSNNVNFAVANVSNNNNEAQATGNPGFNINMPGLNFSFKQRSYSFSESHHASGSFKRTFQKFCWKQKAKHKGSKKSRPLYEKCFCWK